MDQTAISTPARAGGEFFAAALGPTQRRYEALRAYLFEGLSGPAAAGRFGYRPETLASMVRDFRAGRRDFFVIGRPGPKVAPAKEAARDRIVELRHAGRSAYEIARVLAAEGTPLNRTGVAEVLAEQGFARMWPRPHLLRGLPRREVLPRAAAIDFERWPERCETRLAGLLLAVPELVALDLPGLVERAGYPGSKVIPAVSSLLSLLALKLVSLRRVSHVLDLAADPGAALFAGLVALPKATALTTYSYRLSHERQRRFLAALGRAMLDSDLAVGRDFDLDFHAVMHWGEDAALEKHYVPRRSQRTRSVLTFFAQDAGTHNLVYANADLSKAAQAREVLAFCDHWRSVSGADPAMVVLDQRVTTQEVLGQLDRRGVHFITLRMRSPALIGHIEALGEKAWKSVSLDREGNYRKPQVVDEAVTLRLPRHHPPGWSCAAGREAPAVTLPTTGLTAKALIGATPST